MSKQKKSGNAARALQEVKTAAGDKNTTGVKNALAGTESARINQRFGHITSTLMTIYVLFYLCIFPLATHDKYFDILDFRFKLYWIPTLVYGILFLVLGIFYLLSDKRSNGGALTAKLKENLKWSVLKTKLTKTDSCFIALIFIMTLSVLFADYQYEALWGSRGRFNGLVLWLMFFIAYWLVTRFYHFKKWHLYAYLIAACLPEIWGITDFFLIDLFGFHKDAAPAYIYTFVSSVGNINTYTNMVALHLGASVALAVFAKDKREVIISGIAVLTASFAIVMGNSDNGLLASATVFAFLPFVGWTSRRNISRCFAALSTFVTVVIITAHMTIGRPTMIENDGGSMLIKIGKTKAILGFVMLLWGFTAVLYLRCRMKKDEQEKQTIRYARKIWVLLLGVGIVAVLAVLIDANTGNHPGIWEPYQSALVFNDAWGNGRGIIWRFAWEFFTQKSTIFDKLIGNGPDTFFIITMDYFKKAMKAGGIIFDSVHNEYLEYLVTIGILGTIAYIATLMTSLKQLLGSAKNEYAIACGIAVLAYAVQAIVNIAIPITMPILMMLLYVGINISSAAMDGKTEMVKTEKESYEI